MLLEAGAGQVWKTIWRRLSRGRMNRSHLLLISFSRVQAVGKKKNRAVRTKTDDQERISRREELHKTARGSWKSARGNDIVRPAAHDEKADRNPAVAKLESRARGVNLWRNNFEKKKKIAMEIVNEFADAGGLA